MVEGLGFPQKGVPFWGSAIIRTTHSTRGSISGFPYFGKLPYALVCRLLVLAFKALRPQESRGYIRMTQGCPLFWETSICSGVPSAGSSQAPRLYKGYIGIMEKKMEAIV